MIAWNDEQAARLPGVLESARLNGHHDLRMVNRHELLSLEPALASNALAALSIPAKRSFVRGRRHWPSQPRQLHRGCDVRLDTRVESLSKDRECHTLRTSGGAIRSTWLVNAAGLAGDEIHRMAGYDGFRIQPRRGELIVFDKLARRLVNHILLPVPTERSKGVLVTPTVYGNVLVGPTAEDVTDKANDRDDLAGADNADGGRSSSGTRSRPA
jgi:Predicted dehydrogenase